MARRKTFAEAWSDFSHAIAEARCSVADNWPSLALFVLAVWMIVFVIAIVVELA